MSKEQSLFLHHMNTAGYLSMDFTASAEYDFIKDQSSE